MLPCNQKIPRASKSCVLIATLTIGNVQHCFNTPLTTNAADIQMIYDSENKTQIPFILQNGLV